MATRNPKRIPIAVVDKTGAVLPFPRGRTMPEQYYDKVKFFIYTAEELEKALEQQENAVEENLIHDFEDESIAIERATKKADERLDMKQAKADIGLL